MTRRSSDSIGQAALKGALAAVIGGAVMRAVWEAGQRALPAAERLPSPTGGTVDALATRRGVTLSDTQRRAATLGVYTGTMAVWGAVYGAVQTRLHPPMLAHGLLLGGMLYTLNFPKATGVLPKLGVLEPPGAQSRRQAALPIGAHVAFGLATAAAFEALS